MKARFRVSALLGAMLVFCVVAYFIFPPASTVLALFTVGIGVISIVRPLILAPLYDYLEAYTDPLAMCIADGLLTVLYIAVLTPIGLAIRAGRALSRRGRADNTYWSKGKMDQSDAS